MFAEAALTCVKCVTEAYLMTLKRGYVIWVVAHAEGDVLLFSCESREQLHGHSIVLLVKWKPVGRENMLTPHTRQKIPKSAGFLSHIDLVKSQ